MPSGCNDCHTAPPFAPGGDPFAGEPKAVNATRQHRSARGSDVAAVPPHDSNWRDLKHRQPFAPSEANDLLQVMPLAGLSGHDERDLRATYEYLPAIPSLPSTP
jgi:hypothetical protein